MEGAKSGKVLLFTWSPKGETHDVAFKYREHMEEYFRRFKYCCSRFEINPELNQNGNIHYHGFIELKDEIKWYKSVLPKLKRNGFVKLNPVLHDLSKAIEYARKDRQKMQAIITDEPVPLTQDYKFKRPPAYTTATVMYDPITFQVIKTDKPKVPRAKPEGVIPNWPKESDDFGVMYKDQNEYLEAIELEYKEEFKKDLGLFAEINRIVENQIMDKG